MVMLIVCVWKVVIVSVVRRVICDVNVIMFVFFELL